MTCEGKKKACVCSKLSVHCRGNHESLDEDLLVIGDSSSQKHENVVFSREDVFRITIIDYMLFLSTEIKAFGRISFYAHGHIPEGNCALT